MDKISGVYSRTDSYEQVTAPSSGEFYYRFMPPDANNLYGLTPGETYTLSGSVSHTAGELKFRSQYSTDGSSWIDLSAPSDLGVSVSDGSTFASFSHTFTVPVKATGIYISLQNYDYTTGSLFRFKNMKLEKGSVATNWCLSQSELTTTTGSYRGVTLNDRGLTATAGDTTVAMNSNAGFLINNPKHVSTDNPGGQVFHVDTDGNLTISGGLTSSATISGVNFTGDSLTLAGSMKLTGDNSAIASKDGEVVFNKNGISATTATTGSTTDPITVTINKDNPLLIKNKNNDIFKVDNDGSLTISGNLTAGSSPNSTISGVNFTGKSLTLAGSLKLTSGPNNTYGSIASDNGTFCLNNNGLALKGGSLSISDDKGNQTTYVDQHGTLNIGKGVFSGNVTAQSLTLVDSPTVNINVAGKFKVDSSGNVTANSFTSNSVNITGGVLDAGGVNITNINADNITAGTLSGQHLEINGDTKISGVLNVPEVRLQGKSGMIGLDGSNGILISSADTLFQTRVTRYGLDFLTTTNGKKEIMGGITTGANANNVNLNGISVVLDTKQKLGDPYGGDFFSIGTTTSIDNNDNRTWNRAMDYDASGLLHGGGFSFYEKVNFLGGINVSPWTTIGLNVNSNEHTQDPLILTSYKFTDSTQSNYYQPALQVGYDSGSHADSGISFLWNSVKLFGTLDLDGTNIRMAGTDGTFQFGSVHWSDWTDNTPALFRLCNGHPAGIAVGSDGNVILFSPSKRWDINAKG